MWDHLRTPADVPLHYSDQALLIISLQVLKDPSQAAMVRHEAAEALGEAL